MIARPFADQLLVHQVISSEIDDLHMSRTVGGCVIAIWTQTGSKGWLLLGLILHVFR